MTEAMSPDCLIAQGTESNDVPIIVFQIAKLKGIMFNKWICPEHFSLRNSDASKGRN